MRLLLDVGHSDGAAKYDAARGRALAFMTTSDTSAERGALLLCAESVGAGTQGDRAAAAFGDGYHAAADSEPPRRALAEGFDAANAAAHGAEPGRAAVLAGLVLRGRRWCTGHAGNVRVWRCRDMQLKQLTRDHVTPRALGGAEVTLACGLAPQLEAEYAEGELREGDVFLLTSPGVHEALTGSAILGALRPDDTAQEMAEALVRRAIEARAPGYTGACVARVEKLPDETTGAHEETLPLIDPPLPGTHIDGFAIEALVHKSRHYRLYRAEDRESGETVALRFPDPRDQNAAQTLLREERLGQRIASPYILGTIALRPGRRSALYCALEYRPIENLARRVRRKHGLAAEEALLLAEQLLAALEALHGQGLAHGDIRARNLFCERGNHRLWMPGFGPGRAEVALENNDPLRGAGYYAPELFGGAAASERSDVYAAGVAIYYMLTARYPYGRIRSPKDWDAPRTYRPLQDRREGLPPGVDDVLERACAVDPARRYANATQFAAALDNARAAAPRATGSSGNVGERRAGERWAAWLAAAGLAAGLLGYLYWTLR